MDSIGAAKKPLLIAIAFLCLIVHAFAGQHSSAKPIPSQPAFLENIGQWDAQVRFRLANGGKTLWLTDTGIVFDNVRVWPDQSTAEKRSADRDALFARPAPPGVAFGTVNDRLVFSEDFVGANAAPRIEPIDAQPGQYNYMAGSDSQAFTSHNSAGLVCKMRIFPMPHLKALISTGPT